MVSHDRTSAVCRSRVPKASLSKLRKTAEPALNTEPQKYEPPSDASPDCTAADVETILNVDPGANWPCVARLLSGLPAASPNSRLKSGWLSRSWKTFGSYDG